MTERPKILSNRRSAGFTLAELLIALTILGVIATFTIPKVLTAQQDSEWKSIAKETVGMISGAYQAAKLNGAIAQDSVSSDLTPYMNYVNIDTTTQIDDWQTGSDWGCDNSNPCIKLHSGAILQLGQAEFGGTTTLNNIFFQLDPDGKYSNTTNGLGKALNIRLYYNGAVKTMGTIFPGTTSSWSTYPAPDPTLDPPWFSWN